MATVPVVNLVDEDEEERKRVLVIKVSSSGSLGKNFASISINDE